MNYIRNMLIALAGCSAVLTAVANTVYVSVEYGNDETGDGSQANPMKTIQAGVGKLVDGWPSTLWISNGVYKLDAPIVFGDRGGQNYCKVRSMSGNPEDVVIDGQNSVRCIKCEGYETQFHGITVANGYATDGYAAGFYLPRNNYVVSNCVVRNCHSVSSSANVQGGGLFAAKNTTIMDTLFADCSAETTGAAKGAYGGGFMTGYTYNESAEGTMTIRDVAVSNCAVRSPSYPQGGGAWLNRANVNGLVAIDCVASNNAASPTSAVGYGGGVFKRTYVDNTFENVLITNCTANRSGAGFHGEGGASARLSVRNCTFAGNTIQAIPASAAGYGGGANLTVANYEIENSRFSGNRIVSGSNESIGGGIRLSTVSSLADSIVEGNAVVDSDWNTAKGQGGGIYSGSVSVSNCVIAANKARQGGGFYLQDCDGALLTDVFCLSNTALFYSIGSVSGTGNNKGAVVMRNSYFTGNGGETSSGFGSFNSGTKGVNSPVSVEYCTFVSNCVDSTVSFVLFPYHDKNQWQEISAATVSNFFVKGCVFSSNCGKSTFPPSMNTVTNITYTYADTFRANWWTEVPALRNYNKAMMPGGEPPFENLATDRRLRRGTPFINKGVAGVWMGDGAKTGPFDMGDGTYSIADSGKYGVTVLRNNALPRISGGSPDYGCFEFSSENGTVVVFR
ncbi:MAG: hypothetical protein ILM98_12475 [Kiritimatiellae bacterium]|nr:hypothetical protein [Kiritimatiellia bacterium]